MRTRASALTTCHWLTRQVLCERLEVVVARRFRFVCLLLIQAVRFTYNFIGKMPGKGTAVMCEPVPLRKSSQFPDCFNEHLILFCLVNKQTLGTRGS